MRTTYGYMSFKIPSDLPDEELLKQHKQCLREMFNVLERYGGETCTLQEVFEKAQHPDEDMLEHKSVSEVLNEE